MEKVGYILLVVQTPEGNGYLTPNDMKRVDDHLFQLFSLDALFESDKNGPIKQADSNWHVRVHDHQIVPLVKGVLCRHYGLEIVSEEEM